METAAWITYVRNDVEASKAKLLLKSLKAFGTTKPFFILTGKSVTFDTLECLSTGFDGVLSVDNIPELNDELVAKLQCLKLNLTERIIYLRPTLIALRNIDELFDTPVHSVNESDYPKTLTKIELASTLRMKSSTKLYAEIMRTVSTKKSLSTGLDNFDELEGIISWKQLYQNFLNNSPSANDDFNLVDADNSTVQEMEQILEICLNFCYENSMNKNILLDNSTFLSSATQRKEPIAIVGIACRLPGANNLHDFWNNLLNKKDSIVDLPDDRWLPEQSCSIVPDRSKIHAGFLSCPVDEADGKFFGMSPKEMEFTDPQQRFLLEVSWEALEDAAIDPAKLRGSNTGIFTGTWTQDYHDLILKQNESTRDFFRSYLGTSYGSTAGRMAYFYGTMGSNIATESGCSSSIVAVGLACASLQNRKTNMALACGVNILLSPFSPKDMESFTSPDGHSKAFDAKADGFGRAEGCGVLVLKRLSDAIRDGNRIHALIRGYGEAQEGTSRSLGTPTVQCEALAMSTALKDAGVQPEDVQYVEAHGTGTPVGDPMEMAAIAEVYGTPERTPLYVGSVKTNVGHTESCSGITGIIKTVLALENKVIPPHRGLETLNPKIDLESIPAIIPNDSIPWTTASPSKPRMAGVSSFGITGTDAHLILQEAPHNSAEKIKKSDSPNPKHILLLSAKSESALNDKISKYEEFLSKTSQNLKDISFTNNVGRSHFSHRAAVIGTNSKDTAQNMSSSKSITKSDNISSNKQKVCFLFTGQGSQYSGMTQEMYNNLPIFKQHFDLCDQILTKNHNINIRKAIWENSPLINRTLYSQISIFCVEYCISQIWKSIGIIPDSVLGHSLGEFAAACCANMLSLSEALKLVAERSKLIDSLAEGKMIVTRADETQISALLKQLPSHFQLDIAATNSSDQTVLAGSSAAVENFHVLCLNNNIKTSILSSSHAFHSSHMDPILHKYKTVADSVTNSVPVVNCTYISAVNGSVLKSGATLDTSYWLRHTRDRVKFIDATAAAASIGSTVYIEVGPQPILSSFILKNYDYLKIQQPIKSIPSLRKNVGDLDCLLSAIGSLYITGFDMNLKQLYKGMNPNIISIPHYPFQRRKFWFPLSSKTVGNILNSTNEKLLHPLLGYSLPTATKLKVFQNSLNLEQETYIADHVVGKHIIFPAAGYVELAIAAGHCASLASFEDFRQPYSSLVVRNLSVECPLGMTKEESSHIQVVMDGEESKDEGWNPVSIFRREGTSSEAQRWVRHSSCEFSSVVSAAGDYFLPSNDYLQSLSQTEASESLDAFYSKLEVAQLKFGDTFKSLKKIWRNSQEGNSLYKIAVPSLDDKNPKEYLTHPVAIDAMIQAVMFNQTDLNTESITLHVPVRIQKFTWISSDSSSSLYIFVPSKSSSHNQAFLLNENFKLLAIMEGIELVSTTAEAIDAAVGNQKVHIPTILEEIWTPETKNRPIESHPEYLTPEYISKILLDVKNKDDIGQVEQEETKLIHEMISLYYLQALYELNFDKAISESFTSEEFVQAAGIKIEFNLFVRRIFDILTEFGYFKEAAKHSFTKIRDFIPEKMIPKRLKAITDSIKVQTYFCNTLNQIMPKTSKVLRGETSILQELFGEGEKTVAECLYSENPIAKRSNEISTKTMTHLLTNHLNSSSDGKELRILEIGAGTGGTTGAVLPALQQSNVNYTYTFTDLSAGFFDKAAENFKDFKSNLKFKQLDIAVDPREQGFALNHFDIIIAANVLHATKDITATLNNVQLLTKSGGIVMIVEHFTPQKEIDAIFGLLEGYWIFTDFEIRPSHALMSTSSWTNVLSNTGFVSAFPVKCVDGNSGLMLAQASEISNANISSYMPTRKWVLFESQHSQKLSSQLASNLTQLDISVQRITLEDTLQLDGDLWKLRADSKDDMKEAWNILSNSSVEGILYISTPKSPADQTQIAQPFLNLVQTITQLKFPSSKTPKILAVTRGTFVTGDQEPLLTGEGTLMGMVRVYKSEFPHNSCRTVDLEPSGSLEEDITAIISEMWQNDPNYFVTYRQGIRHTVQLNHAKLKQNPLSLPNSNRYRLQLPSTKSISDLAFIPHAKIQLKDDDVEIQVKAAALNFRDVFAVLKPSAYFENVNSLGFDFSGVVTSVGKSITKFKVGDCVIAGNYDQIALPSHRVNKQFSVAHLPPTMTFAEGATLPAVFVTAYYCLVDITKLSKGETILIHTASGGVGLVAIQLAKRLGAEIIATAGSKRKRAYLKSLGIQHVFDSRTLEYESQINKVTHGKGVHVVLNSLTGPGFKEASIRCLTPKGRFIEMSKLNVWTTEEANLLRPDVEYSIIDLTSVPDEISTYLYETMALLLNGNEIQPIPFIKYDNIYIREALTFLQRARHIGKVVVMMPEMSLQHGNWEPSFKDFNDRSTYVITGGLGGIGLEAAKWMASEGAKHIVLTGRRQPQTDKASKVIQQLLQDGVTVHILLGDVGKPEDVRRIFDTIDETLPPVRGIMHAAGCISDALYPDITWKHFQTTLNAKVTGTLNLHEISCERNYRLEHFVLYSSMVAIMGSMGQSNHAAGNAFMDSFAHYRNAIGLPATSVNWGQWGQVGVAADMEISAFTPFTPKEGFAALKLLMSTHTTQATVLEADFDKIKLVLVWMQKAYAKNIKSNKNSLTNNSGKIYEISSDEFWRTLESIETHEEKETLLASIVSDVLKCILKFDDSETIDPQQNFQEIGLDSLMMVEFKNVLQGFLGSKIVLTASDIADCNSVHLITRKLMSLIYSESALMTKEEYVTAFLIRSRLDLNIPPNLIKPSPLIKTVLVVGSSFNYGDELLKLLNSSEEISKIYCLYAEKLSTTDYKKVTFLKADVGLKECFHLEESVYKSLTHEVDAIIHCGDPFKSTKAKAGKNSVDVESIKKNGISNLIKFAATEKLKQIYYATFLFPEGKGYQGCGVLPEKLPNENDLPDYLEMGYTGSRFVSERLISQAIDKGIPCKVFRLPYMAGNSLTGEFSAQDENHVFLKFMGYMMTGMMPTVPIPFTLLPIDFCAKVTLELFTECHDAPSGVYNITNPHKYSMKDFFEVSEQYGKPMRSVELHEFMAEVDKDGGNSLMNVIKDIYGDPVASGDEAAKENYRRLAALSEDFKTVGMISQFIPSFSAIAETPLEIIKRDLKFANDSEIFQKFVAT